MEKFECKNCGNTEFMSTNSGDIICRYGVKWSDPKWEEDTDGFIDSVQRLNVEAILKISLLKWKIDRCLDERNKERFKKVSSELTIYEEIVKTCTEHPEFFWDERFEETLGQT